MKTNNILGLGLEPSRLHPSYRWCGWWWRGMDESGEEAVRRKCVSLPVVEPVWSRFPGPITRGSRSRTTWRDELNSVNPVNEALGGGVGVRRAYIRNVIIIHATACCRLLWLYCNLSVSHIIAEGTTPPPPYPIWIKPPPIVMAEEKWVSMLPARMSNDFRLKMTQE